MSVVEIPEWPYVYGRPSAQGIIRHFPEDFLVIENLSFEPEGQGEHAFLYVEKKDENTDYIARQLARFAQVRQQDVSYAGLKDRHAVTRQWFSIWLPGKPDLDWSILNSPTLKVLKNLRHARKLKRGALSSNQFTITIRQLQGDKAVLIQRLEAIKQGGIANYFGSQRFGLSGQNINKALELFAGKKAKREQRSLYLSAARSYLFNQVLSQRVQQNNWNQAIPGDVFMFDQSHSCFSSEHADEGILARLHAGAIHPVAALWGLGQSGAALEALQLEQQVIEENKELAQGLLNFGLEMDKRALRVMLQDFTWHFDNDDLLSLNFTLPAGSYATSVLREIIEI
ncbi:MAG: tRNA pseudouridine(13) synthase TruD [Methylococcaceae bacterium]|jgi:tRNA pseudouridine13 synthase